MSALLELAARVEALTGPDREVDAEIAVAVSGDSGAFVVAPMEDCIFQHIPGWWRDGADKSHDAPEYTASLDAAMSLVPKGCGFNLDRYWMIGREGSAWRCDLSFGGTPDSPRRVGRAEDAYSAATAITAAALRAKAVGEGV